MPDPIQVSSTIPLPEHQTQQGRLDPLPQGSPELRAKLDSQETQQRTADQNDAFRAYLDRTQVTHVAEIKRGLEYDHANDINDASPYKDSGRSRPI